MATMMRTNLAAKATAVKSVAPLPQRTVSRLPVQKTMQKSSSPARSAVSSQALPEVAEVAQGAMPLYTTAGEAGFITGTALTMVAMTLVGLALGFVLLRVESLVEEGKI
ncbi:hypothetical protein DUNSADRAFT_6705 [Dunaliella salina]|uniref:Uncharacterized protein n=1 Tax=Dunaliella salina TaxID=3046 RepID=A0ABQ7GMQ3_DUNSA|nr:hypothetical protein DUNSADRAFT_6705 [Dunaliella salina]|eukprot:KAF5835892.1 hypothetical protein DUNSADRAFT_6705 [Dunaliella salina]